MTKDGEGKVIKVHVIKVQSDVVISQPAVERVLGSGLLLYLP